MAHQSNKTNSFQFALHLHLPSKFFIFIARFPAASTNVLDFIFSPNHIFSTYIYLVLPFYYPILMFLPLASSLFYNSRRSLCSGLWRSTNRLNSVQYLPLNVFRITTTQTSSAGSSRSTRKLCLLPNLCPAWKAYPRWLNSFRSPAGRKDTKCHRPPM